MEFRVERRDWCWPILNPVFCVHRDCSINSMHAQTVRILEKCLLWFEKLVCGCCVELILNGFSKACLVYIRSWTSGGQLKVTGSPGKTLYYNWDSWWWYVLTILTLNQWDGDLTNTCFHFCFIISPAKEKGKDRWVLFSVSCLHLMLKLSPLGDGPACKHLNHSEESGNWYITRKLLIIK